MGVLGNKRALLATGKLEIKAFIDKPYDEDAVKDSINNKINNKVW